MALVASAQVPAPAQVGPAFRALLFTRTEGFRHTSIEPAIAAFQELGEMSDFAVEATEDPRDFNDDNLARFDVVVFLLTTGDVLGPKRQRAFRRYIEGGGAFMGVHSAADSEYDWPFFGRLVGTYFESHARSRPGRVLVLDRHHPSTAPLPLRWERTDEWYNFRSNPRGKVHVLATIDETSYEGKKMDPDHPVSWCRTVHGGRSWYTGLGHTDESYSEPEFRDHLLGGIEWAAGVAEGDCTGTVWSNLQKVSLDRDLQDPMELAVAHDSRVFFVERLGKVKVYDPGESATEVVGTIDVFSGNEDGLLGIALDPNFEVTKWLYLFYSPAGDDHVQRVSRFTLEPEGLDLGSEQVILEIPTQRDRCCHSAGSLAFGENGNLYISVGDNTDPFESGGYTPIDERAGREAFDAQRTGGNTNDLRGKILRIHPEPDGSYTIPQGNLFPEGTPQTRPEIYVMGVRNPFRLHFDLSSMRLLWGDVGPDARTSSRKKGPKGFDEFNVAAGPGNYGWPYCIAGNKAYRHYDFETGKRRERFDCTGGPRNESPNNTGITELPPATGSSIAYPYGRSKRFPTMGTGGGRSAFAGPVLRRGPSLGEEALPPYYEGTFFALEWARRFVREVRFDDSGRPVAVSPFMSDTTFRRPMDMAQGPDGSLYLLEWGSAKIRGNGDSGLYRIVSTQPGQRYPTARARADKTSGDVPLTVHFTGSRSSDPDEGQELTFAWDLDADGIVDSTAADPSHTFSTIGDFSARLVVTDTTGKTSTSTVRIAAGNRKPKVAIRSPARGGFFSWGDGVRAKVRVDDVEDGATAEGIRCSDVKLQGLLGHNAHTHPLTQRSACSGVFETGGEESHGNAAADLFYAIQATYTDRGNGLALPLTTQKTFELQPKVKEAEHFDGRVDAVTARHGDVVRIRRSGGHLILTPVNLRRIRAARLHAASVRHPTRVEIRKGGPNGTLLGSALLQRTSEPTTKRIALADASGTFDLYAIFDHASDPDHRGTLVDVDRFRFLGRGVGI